MGEKTNIENERQMDKGERVYCYVLFHYAQGNNNWGHKKPKKINSRNEEREREIKGWEVGNSGERKVSAKGIFDSLSPPSLSLPMADSHLSVSFRSHHIHIFLG